MDIIKLMKAIISEISILIILIHKLSYISKNQSFKNFNTIINKQSLCFILLLQTLFVHLHHQNNQLYNGSKIIKKNETYQRSKEKI